MASHLRQLWLYTPKGEQYHFLNAMKITLKNKCDKEYSNLAQWKMVSDLEVKARDYHLLAIDRWTVCLIVPYVFIKLKQNSVEKKRQILKNRCFPHSATITKIFKRHMRTHKTTGQISNCLVAWPKSLRYAGTQKF